MAGDAAGGVGGGRVRKSAKQKTLDQITSLDADDDERTSISKKISWILRHGTKTKKVNLKIIDEEWVKVSDLNQIDILDDVPNEKLRSVINESNQQKPRYELKESPTEGLLIKAVSKSERRAEREKERENASKFGTDRAKPTGGGAEIKDATHSTSMRMEAPVFIPSTNPMAAAQAMGYPYPYGAAYPPYGYGAYSPMMTPYAQGAPVQSVAQTYTPAAPVSSGRFRGRIKTFNTTKGFGFIECAEAHAVYGRDVFLHKANVGDLDVGCEVTFTVELNKDGMPQARGLSTSQAEGKPSGKSRKGGGKNKWGDGEGKGKGGHEKGGSKKGGQAAR